MSEMVERVARAISDARFTDGVPINWEGAFRARQFEFEAQARAAIAAMREPTEAMIVVAALDPSNQGHVSQTGTWQAMIDEALK